MCTKLATKKHDPIDQDAARTLDGQRPIGTAKPWISPRRPYRRSKAFAVDSADDDFYCPDCDWQQYYCLCAAATSVDGAEYWEMAARRAQETGLYGFEHGRERRGLRATVDRRPAATTEEEKKTDDDGASSAGRTEVVSTTGGDGSVDGRTVAVDEGGDGRSSVGTALEGEIALAATSQGVVGAGGDDGRTSVGRQTDDDDVLLMRRPATATTSWQTTHAGDWTDEELAEFAESFDAGDVRVCCQWTAHRRYAQEDEDDMEANPHEWERKCCVWIRRGERGDSSSSSEEESSSLLGKRRSSNDDEEETEDEEDWTQPWDPDEVPDRSPTPIPDVALQSEPLSVKLGRRPYRSPYSWRSPNVGGILYATTTTTTTTTLPRRSRRLSAKLDADWTRRAQESIDEEAALDDRIRDAEEELRRRVDARVECERRLERLSLLPKRRRILVRSRYFATSGKTATTSRRQPSNKKKTTK